MAAERQFSDFSDWCALIWEHRADKCNVCFPKCHQHVYWLFASHIVSVACFRSTIAGLELIPLPFWLWYRWQCSRHTFRPIWTNSLVLSHSGKDVPTLSAIGLQDLVEHVRLLKCRPVYDSVTVWCIICPTANVWSIDINLTFFLLPLSFI